MMPGGFVHGAQEITAALHGISERVELAVARAVAESAHALEAQTKVAFTTSHAKGEPTPAGKGDPPSVVTGTLRRSIKTEGPIRVGFGSYRAEVGPTVIYARRQELDPAYDHPFLAPSYDKWLAAKDLERRMTAAIREAVR